MPKQSSNAKATKVLFIDDEPAFLELYKDKFAAEGFEVKVCNESENAWNLITIYKPDIIFLDLVMANTDGIGLLKKIKGTPETQWITIVMLSNIDNDADKKECLNEGASQFLIKSSFTPQELVAYTKKILKLV
jgi:two-component system, OmpR family, response regulator BaeR